jgi:hypothetical protein
MEKSRRTATAIRCPKRVVEEATLPVGGTMVRIRRDSLQSEFQDEKGG